VVEQLLVGSDNFSYVVWCPVTQEAVIIDPSMEIGPQTSFMRSKGLRLKFIISTHHHYDHTFKVEELRELTGARSLIGNKDASLMKESLDETIVDGQELTVGTLRLKVFETPGHTPGSICILDLDDGALFTGDTLFIDDCGRADLPGGDVRALFKSIQILKALPGHLTVYPGHDYGDRPFDKIERQIRTNRAMLAKDLEDFLTLP
jgi:glyoxylase-like metal-dependent hydrolase (beta-lactamase superfamily II)